MKVVFLKDVPKIGKKHEIREVADGFAYNSLIPRKLAVPATPAHVRAIEELRASATHAKEVKESVLRDLSVKSTESPIQIAAPSNEQGHLFKSLRGADIVEAIRTQHGVVLDEKDVALLAPLKEVGVHEVMLRGAGIEVPYVCTIVAQKK